jgi:hypothetical protein
MVILGILCLANFMVILEFWEKRFYFYVLLGEFQGTK